MVLTVVISIREPSGVNKHTSGLTIDYSCCHPWYDYMYNLDGNPARTVTDGIGRQHINIKKKNNRRSCPIHSTMMEANSQLNFLTLLYSWFSWLTTTTLIPTHMQRPRKILFIILVHENPAWAQDTQNAFTSICVSGSLACSPGWVSRCHTRYKFLASRIDLSWKRTWWCC